MEEIASYRRTTCKLVCKTCILATLATNTQMRMSISAAYFATFATFVESKEFRPLQIVYIDPTCIIRASAERGLREVVTFSGRQHPLYPFKINQFNTSFTVLELSEGLTGICDS